MTRKPKDLKRFSTLSTFEWPKPKAKTENGMVKYDLEMTGNSGANSEIIANSGNTWSKRALFLFLFKLIYLRKNNQV